GLHAAAGGDDRDRRGVRAGAGGVRDPRGRLSRPRALRWIFRTVVRQDSWLSERDVAGRTVVGEVAEAELAPAARAGGASFLALGSRQLVLRHLDEERADADFVAVGDPLGRSQPLLVHVHAVVAAEIDEDVLLVL